MEGNNDETKKSWEITDEFWAVPKPLIPQPERDSEKTYIEKAQRWPPTDVPAQGA